MSGRPTTEGKGCGCSARGGRTRVTRAGILVAWLLAAVAAPPVAARELAIESFDARITVAPDAGIEVVESIRFRFTGSWNGIIRDIPVEYRTPQGFGFNLDLDLKSVTGDDGRPLKHESKRVRHYREIKIWVPDANDAVRTVVLRYTVANALRFFEQHDELYWNVTGDEWEMPIEHATATVTLPSSSTGARSTVFTGAFGSRERDADVVIDGHEVRFTLRRPLAFREGLTAVVGWDKGAVRPPPPTRAVVHFLGSNWPLLIPVGVFALMFRTWWRRGRDPRRLPVAPRYEPPDNLSPAGAGTLIDGSPDLRDITATLVDLAVRGHILIEEKTEPGPLGLWSNQDYVFTRRTPSETTALKPHEQRLLVALFKGGGRDKVELSDLANSFYRDLPGIRDAIFEELMGRGFYRDRPDKVRQRYIVTGIVMTLLSIHAGAFLSGFLGLPGLTVGLSVALSGVIILLFGLVMPARTLPGARALEGVLGFEEFLTRVEADRFERLVRTPELFEKYLPYAMALGVEGRWVKAFEDLYQAPPDWYRGTAGRPFRPGSFVGDLGRMSSRAGTAMSSSPRSSGGSGFSGGSSGGGGGGGGGRGF